MTENDNDGGIFIVQEKRMEIKKLGLDWFMQYDWLRKWNAQQNERFPCK